MEPSVPGDQTRPSWDVQRESAPERPAFVSGLPEEQRVPRPRRVLAAFVLVCISVLAFIGTAVIVALQFDEVRDSLISALPDDLTEDYESTDIERAAGVLLMAIGGLALLLLLAQFLGTRSVVFTRNITARATTIVFTSLAIPVMLLAAIVIEAKGLTAALAGVTLTGMLLATLLLGTPRVSRWLRQSDERRAIPMARPDQD